VTQPLGACVRNCAVRGRVGRLAGEWLRAVACSPPQEETREGTGLSQENGGEFLGRETDNMEREGDLASWSGPRNSQVPGCGLWLGNVSLKVSKNFFGF
jgi:hypothetical protein